MRIFLKHYAGYPRASDPSLLQAQWVDLRQNGSVTVEFTDGSSTRYDLKLF